MLRRRTTFARIAKRLRRHPWVLRRLLKRGHLLAHAEAEPGVLGGNAHYFDRPITPLPKNATGDEAFVNPPGKPGAAVHVPHAVLTPEVGLTIFDRPPGAPGPSLGVLGKEVVSGHFSAILVPRAEPGVTLIYHDEEEWARLCEGAERLIYAAGGYPPPAPAEPPCGGWSGTQA